MRICGKKKQYTKGDIRGQFYDLLSIFRKHGYPPDMRYLFLGNIINDGNFGVHCLHLLLLLKLKYPNHIYLLRGRYESKRMSYVGGFCDECNDLYDNKKNIPEIAKTSKQKKDISTNVDLTYVSEIYYKYNNDNIKQIQSNENQNKKKNEFFLIFYNLMTDFVCLFPIAAIINHKIYCVTGGIPSDMSYDVLKIQHNCNRKRDFNQELGNQDPLTDTLWSQPEKDITGFQFSTQRGYVIF